MLRAYITSIATLLGLAFGSFLNVCATRLPDGESIVSPGSHCRSCRRTLPWHENLPLVSWLVLRGRCSSCRAPIGWRYPIVELAVAFTWAVIAWQAAFTLSASLLTADAIFETGIIAAGNMIFCWLLILLATLDAENLWLPDRLTLGGAALGVPFALVRFGLHWALPLQFVEDIKSNRAVFSSEILPWLAGIILAPSIILIVRWSYRLVRRREGIGLGDAKLMLLLAVWLGLANTMLAFVLGVVLGTFFAIFLLAVPRARRDDASWLLNRIPLGSFLCVGGILSALWGSLIVNAYLRAAGF